MREIAATVFLLFAPLEAARADRLPDAIERGASYLTSEAAQIAPAHALLYEALRGRYPTAGLPSLASAYERLSDGHSSAGLVAVYRRLVDASAGATVEQILALRNSIDEMTARALHCDRTDLPPDYVATLRRHTTRGGYNLTHAALSSRWALEQGCLTRETLQPLIDEQRAELVGLALARLPSDPGVQAVAMILYVRDDSREDVSPWIERIVEAQREDGGWAETPAQAESTAHATLNALWALLLAAHPAVSEPLIPQSPR